MGRLISPEFHKTKQDHFLDFDAIVTMTFPDIECIERMKVCVSTQFSSTR